MIRRTFLSRAIGVAAASLFTRAAWAQHAGHAGMAGMDSMDDMPGMSGMPGMAGHGPRGKSAPAALAAADALPAGAPLAALRTLANESREPGMFRATLVAQPVARPMLHGARPTTFWQFGAGTQGPVVGPLIDVREGDTVEIKFVNKLPQPSTIHWHGLPVPPDQDGNPSDPVAPGASRVYRFTLPKGSAGTYWYHPHPHMMTAEQVFRGLAGPFVVRAVDDPLAGWPERNLFVSDLKLARDGTIAPNDMMDWMNGREGQFVLVNGARRPRIDVAGDERWRVWNACSARYLRVAFDDGRAFEHAGTDGGLFDAPRRVTSLLIAPGERAELLVRAGDRASRAVLQAAEYDRRKMSMSHDDGHGSLPPDPALALADVAFAPAAARALPATLRAVPSLGEPIAHKEVAFGEEMDMDAMMKGAARGRPAGMRFTINGDTYAPHRTTLTSRRGDVERWTIRNGTDMDHPFHLHGTQFQVIERASGDSRTSEPFRAWRDTVNVRSGETVTILVTQDMPGERMFHCHILEHEDLGMMGTLKVV
ncbi:multicopper oxidase family protein [Burkholderia contaminans]|uniref:multicopper oxidase family protein n=1 Tax=Burkholderia contaminans TaxID=488447 RepID=UPI000F596C30|nr:multicopper oxidase family protein [Burkholderia contaminans]MCA8154980.1 multicopper oxidase family protein [Burkholderia contaminans]RQT11966.1 multicopper oxidase family protein [Burkholderia contaminans]VWD55485.1 copper oxidase [Burkholderia contaminans]